MNQKLKTLLKLLAIFALFFAAFSVLYILAFFNEFNNIPPHLMLEVESDSLIENVTLLFPIYTYMNQDIEFWDCSGADCNISVVETEYGRMWKIWMSNVGWTREEVEKEEVSKTKIGSGGSVVLTQPYDPNQLSIDLFSIDLNPKLGYSENVSENGRYYVRTANITVPVCVDYEGNLTEVRVKLIVQSGVYNIVGLIPWSPKHDGKVYAGWRVDEFTLDFKGCRNVTGTSKISIVYQQSE